MKLSETLSACFGHIRYYDTDQLMFDKSNTITYRAADLLARIVAGDRTAVPSHIGFLYGTTDTPGDLVDPATLVGADRRDWTMDRIASMVADNQANIAVASLAQRPSTKLRERDDPSLYAASTTVFSAHTGMVEQHLFAGAGFAAPLDSLDPAYVYQVLLLSKQSDGSFELFAISQLGMAPFVAKVESRHQAVFWDITFK